MTVFWFAGLGTSSILGGVIMAALWRVAGWKHSRDSLIHAVSSCCIAFCLSASPTTVSRSETDGCYGYWHYRGTNLLYFWSTSLAAPLLPSHTHTHTHMYTHTHTGSAFRATANHGWGLAGPVWGTVRGSEDLPVTEATTSSHHNQTNWYMNTQISSYVCAA